jgi:hypothetical protein
MLNPENDCTLMLVTGLFEGDQDLDLEIDVHDAIIEKMKTRDIELGDDDLFESLQAMGPRSSETNSIRRLRSQLDTICAELFEDYTKKDDSCLGEYSLIMLDAVMMKSGAKMSPGNRTKLLQVAQRSESASGYRPPMWDMSFRDAGKAQFIAAVNHYKDGDPRDFISPRYVSLMILIQWSLMYATAAASLAAESVPIRLLPPSSNAVVASRLGTAVKNVRKQTGRGTSRSATVMGALQ